MANLVNQPTAMPTRKMLMGALGSIVAAALQQWFISMADSLPMFAFLGEPVVEEAVPIVAFFLVGYFMREKEV